MVSMNKLTRRFEHQAALAGILGISASLFILAGCSQNSLEPGYASQCRTQLQFLSPPGATVAVRGGPTRSHEIPVYGAYDNRLEQSPEQFSVFNLAPGRYEFKYTAAEGLPGASIYGELDVEHANSHMARVFQRRSFVPIALPSEHYKKAEVNGDQIFPYRGEAYRTAIDEQDLERLKLGDVVEKVFFVADLEKAAKTRDRLLRDLKVCERKMEYAESRFRLAHQDFRAEVTDPVANLLGTDREFIRWEEKRQELSQKYEKLQKKLQRIQALLAGDHVLIREGMLALATQQIVEPHRDVEEAAEDLGEVILVMRIGGRHMHWGDPRRELASYEPLSKKAQ
jgi:hypothetical protein